MSGYSNQNLSASNIELGNSGVCNLTTNFRNTGRIDFREGNVSMTCLEQAVIENMDNVLIDSNNKLHRGQGSGQAPQTGGIMTCDITDGGTARILGELNAVTVLTGNGINAVYEVISENLGVILGVKFVFGGTLFQIGDTIELPSVNPLAGSAFAIVTALTPINDPALLGAPNVFTANNTFDVGLDTPLATITDFLPPINNQPPVKIGGNFRLDVKEEQFINIIRMRLDRDLIVRDQETTVAGGGSRITIDTLAPAFTDPNTSSSSRLEFRLSDSLAPDTNPRIAFLDYVGSFLPENRYFSFSDNVDINGLLTVGLTQDNNPMEVREVAESGDWTNMIITSIFTQKPGEELQYKITRYIRYGNNNTANVVSYKTQFRGALIVNTAFAFNGSADVFLYANQNPNVFGLTSLPLSTRRQIMKAQYYVPASAPVGAFSTRVIIMPCAMLMRSSVNNNPSRCRTEGATCIGVQGGQGGVGDENKNCLNSEYYFDDTFYWSD